MVVIKIKKLISLITAGSLMLSFVISPASVNAMTNEEATRQYKQIFKDFILPYSYGQISKAHYGAADRLIINIQDLHCHPAVQKSISNIIDTFDKKYGVKNVYLEGAYGRVSTKWIAEKTEPDKLSETLDKMLETGRLTGAEYYSAISGKNNIIKGLESKEPFLENLKRFGTIINNQEKIDLILKEISNSTENLKEKYFSKRQRKIEELSKSYKEGKISPQKYYALMSKHIDKLGIDINKYENTLSYIMLLELQKNLEYTKITKELHTLLFLLKERMDYNAYNLLLTNTDNFSKIDKLYAYIIQITRLFNLDLTVNFKNLDKYFRYIELSQKINPLTLIYEEEKLTEEINTRFSETKAQREVVFLTNFERYLKDYVSSKITSQDYEYYSKNISEYKKLWNKYVDNRVLSMLDVYLAEADKFYKINNDRNIYFTNNMFDENSVVNKIDGKNNPDGEVNKIIENMAEVKEVDVVITGGFHSQTVTEILQTHGVSYIVITPNVSEGISDAEEKYYDMIKEQSKIGFQALAPRIASLSPALQNRIMDAIISPEKRDSTAAMSESERINLISELTTARILESDDTGDMKDVLIEIMKEIVDEEYKSDITAGLLEHIKPEDMLSFIQDKDQLQTFIDASKGSIPEKVAEILQLPKTVSFLNSMGKRIYKNNREKAYNFRFSALGVAAGVLYETVKWWSPKFVKQHENHTKKMSAVVWAGRAVSVVAGIAVALNPATGILAALVAVLSSEWIFHFIYDKIQINKSGTKKTVRHNVSRQRSVPKAVSKEYKPSDINAEMLGNFMSFDNAEYPSIIEAAFAPENADKKFEYLKILLGEMFFIPRDISNIVFRHALSYIKEQQLSDEEKDVLFDSIVRHIKNFGLDKTQAAMLFDECEKYIETNKNNKKNEELLTNMLYNIYVFDRDSRKKLVDLIFSMDDIKFKNNMARNILFCSSAFLPEQIKTAFDVFMNEAKNKDKKYDGYLYSSLISSSKYLDQQRIDEIFDFMIDNTDYDKVRLLSGLLNNADNFRPEQKKEIYRRFGDFISDVNSPQKDKIDLIENFAEKFSLNILDDIQKKSVTDTVTDFLKNAAKSKEKSVKAEFLLSLLKQIDVFDSEQKTVVANTALDYISKLKADTANDNENIALIQSLLNKKAVFDSKIQKKISNISGRYNLIFSSKRIGNHTYSDLIERIKGINAVTDNLYRFFNIKNVAEGNDMKNSFSHYKKLEEENLQALKKLTNMTSDQDLPELKMSLDNMFKELQELADSSLIGKIDLLEQIIEEFFSNKNMDIKAQSDLHGYNINTITEADSSDITINDLINVVHQTAINAFKVKMRNMTYEKRGVSSVQNFSDNGYINPEISKILSKITEMQGATVCFDENTIVVSIIPLDKHSTTIIVNLDNMNRGISFSFYDITAERIKTVENVLDLFGFSVDNKQNFLNAKLNKETGLDDDTDLAEKFEQMLKTFYLTVCYETEQFFSYGAEGYAQKQMLAVNEGIRNIKESSVFENFNRDIREGKIFNTKDNLNSILKNLGLPELPEDADIYYEEPESHIKTVSQSGIDKYFNNIIDKAFSEGKIILDSDGYLTENKDYSELSNIKVLLTQDKSEQETMIRQASVIDELNKKGNIFNFSTKAKVGECEYQTGYLKLSDGKYISVNVLKNSTNGMIRYARAELVDSDGKRTVLNKESLTEMLLNNGYTVNKNIREKSEKEKSGYILELGRHSTVSSNISKQGRVLGTKKHTAVTGKIVFDSENVKEGESILMKEYLNPEDMKGTLKAKGIILSSGMELSHQGLIVKEKGITTSIITGVSVKEKDGRKIAELKYLEYTGNVQNINGFEVETAEEKTKIIEEGSVVAIDGETGKVVIFPQEFAKGITAQVIDGYIESGDIDGLKTLTAKINQSEKEQIDEYIKYKTLSMSKPQKEQKSQVSFSSEDKDVVSEREISRNINDNIKGFDDDAMYEYFGTKATNLQSMYQMIRQMQKDLGIKTTVPYGVMIGAGAFLQVLNKNKNFQEIYDEYVEAVTSGDFEKSFQKAGEITEIISNLGESDLHEFKKIIDQKVQYAVKKGYASRSDSYAVRSAFIGEDGKKFSSAGVGESKVGINGEKIADMLINIVLKSVYAERSVAYQTSNKNIFIPAALVQVAVDSEKSAVLAVRDGKIVISGSLGQGEIVVSGEKAQSVIETELGANGEIEITDYKTERQDYQYGLNGEVKPVPAEKAASEIFSKAEIENISKIGLYLKEKYGYDADIELAIKDGTIYVLQIRPLTDKTSSDNETVQNEQSADTSSEEQNTVMNESSSDEEKNITSVAAELAFDSVNPVAAAQNMSIKLISGEKAVAELEQDTSVSIDENLIITDNPDDIINLKRQGIKAVTADFSSERGGEVIGEYKGVTIRAKWNSEKNEIVLCAKKGISFTEEDKTEILKLLTEAQRDGAKISVFEGIKQVVTVNSGNITSVVNTIKNIHTDSVMMPSKELKFDISARKSVNGKNISSICLNESKATEAASFIISSENAEDKDIKEAIENLQKNGYKFIINYKNSKESGDILYNGAKINAEDIDDAAKAVVLLKRLQEEKLQKGIDTQISVKFSKEIYESLSGTDIFGEYGIIPVTDMSVKVTGKKEIEIEDAITKEMLEKILRDETVVSIVINEKTKELVSKNKKIIKEVATKQLKYNKGLKAALNSKFDYTAKDINGNIFDILTTDVNAVNLKEIIDNMDLINFSDDSKNYIEYLKSKDKYEELAGFIRGVVMNTAADKISNIIKLNKTDFIKDRSSKTVQAVLVMTVQRMMNGESIEQIYGTIKGSDTMSARDYLDSIKVKLNGILDKVLKENENRINNKVTVVAADFDGIPELLMDLYGNKATAAQEVKISIGAIKGILAAA